mmetsp:Transcript_8286/g.18612  ORF Transcript_8286/g.18612 Transcript_8286/m.18612 type:complete len:92 (-) Transcript_8286:81-356(-)
MLDQKSCTGGLEILKLNDCLQGDVAVTRLDDSFQDDFQRLDLKAKKVVPSRTVLVLTKKGYQTNGGVQDKNQSTPLRRRLPDRVERDLAYK